MPQQIKATHDEISFNISKADQELINKIMRRADKLELYHLKNRINVEMSLVACHANAAKLDLQRLLAADDFNFCHDVVGIDAHISRDTGLLMHCFRPRFCMREQHLEFKGR